MNKVDALRLAFVLGLTVLCLTSYFWQRESHTTFPPSMSPDGVQLYHLNPCSGQNNNVACFRAQYSLHCPKTLQALESCVAKADDTDCKPFEASVQACHDKIMRAYDSASSQCADEVYYFVLCRDDHPDNAATECKATRETVDTCVARALTKAGLKTYRRSTEKK